MAEQAVRERYVRVVVRHERLERAALARIVVGAAGRARAVAEHGPGHGRFGRVAAFLGGEDVQERGWHVAEPVAPHVEFAQLTHATEHARWQRLELVLDQPELDEVFEVGEGGGELGETIIVEVEPLQGSTAADAVGKRRDMVDGEVESDETWTVRGEVVEEGGRHMLELAGMQIEADEAVVTVRDKIGRDLGDRIPGQIQVLERRRRAKDEAVGYIFELVKREVKRGEGFWKIAERDVGDEVVLEHEQRQAWQVVDEEGDLGKLVVLQIQALEPPAGDEVVRQRRDLVPRQDEPLQIGQAREHVGLKGDDMVARQRQRRQVTENFDLVRDGREEVFAQGNFHELVPQCADQLG